MEKDKAIDVLNSLITINNDRIEGYEKASEISEELDLKTLFTKFISTSQKCNQELEKEVSKLGGEKTEGTKASGKFFRTWMDVKAALTGKDRKAILNSCEYGEEKAQSQYDDVLGNKHKNLNPDHKTLIKGQKSSLRADHNQVKVLLEALAEV